jgi:peptide/nickel transport system substrate-binding protein
MKKKIVWLLLSCLMVVALALASCGPAVTEEEEEEEVVTEEEEEEEVMEEEEEEGPEMVRDSVGNLVEKPKYGGVFTLARSTDVNYFDEIGRYIHSSQSQQLTNEALFRGDWTKGPTGTGEASWYYHMFPSMDLQAGLVAESWELVDDTTIVLHIRQGIHFQDKPPTNGRELVADDVVYSLWRIWNIETSYNYAAYPWDIYFESMEATDKYTVVIKATSTAKLAGIFDMMFNHHKMVPKDAVELYGDLYDWENAIGTGPFLLVDYVPVSSLTFERNPNYWMDDPLHPGNQLPYLDGVKWLVIPDLSTRTAAIRTHKIDWLALNWEEADALIKTNPELMYVSYLTAGSSGLWFRYRSMTRGSATPCTWP